MRAVSSSVKAAVSRVETRMIGVDNRLARTEDELRRTGSALQLAAAEVSQLTEGARKTERETASLRERVEEREKEVRLSEKFMGRLREVQNDLQFVVGYLQQYQPLRTQMQIADTLAACTHGRQRRLLCAFEDQQFARLHENILNGEAPSLQDLTFDFTSGLAKIINRNRQFMTELALSSSRDKPAPESREGEAKGKELQEGDILRLFGQEWAGRKE
jgi:uncharacterized protein YfcZ (UPF0381/DUF406 family)